MNMRSSHVSIAAVVLAIVAFALQGCSSSDDHDHAVDDEHNQTLLVVRGTVIDVAGDLSTIAHITLLMEDGRQMDFVPAAGTLFDGGPISHIRDHLISGAPVEFKYRESEDGTLVAVELGDAHD